MPRSAIPNEGSRMIRAIERLRVKNRVRRGMSRAARFDGLEDELPFVQFLVDAKRNAIDVGANKGLYSELLAPLCKHVTAYEANPALVARLRPALPENVELRQKAVSSGAGQLTFYVPLDAKGKQQPNIGSLEESSGPGGRDEIPTEVCALDAEKLTDIGFIKIDVEGHELDVLRGAKTLLATERPNLLVEILDKDTAETAQIGTMMRDLNYVCLELRQGILRYIGEDLSLAKQKNLIFLPNDGHHARTA